VVYFSVVLTRTEDGWDSNDIELDEVDSLTELADAMRESADDPDAEGPFLLLLEQEDMWFAVVRVDGDEDPRVFVSDRSAIEHSAYAEMLLEAAESGGEPVLALESDGEEDVDEADAYGDEDDDEEETEADDGPVGDLEILADYGTSAATLLELCAGHGVLPSEALTQLAERAGAAGALETVR
jgi:putative tRNA adenosine deaminase-associated protein